MDFNPIQPKRPVKLTGLDLILKYRQQHSQVSKTIEYWIELVDEEGRVVAFADSTGDLKPYMTVQQVATAESFLDAIVTKAQCLIP